MSEQFTFAPRGPAESEGKLDLPEPQATPSGDQNLGGGDQETFSFTERPPNENDLSFKSNMERAKSLMGGAIASGAGALSGAGVGVTGAFGKNARVMQQSIDKLAAVLASSPDTAEKIIAARGGLPPPTGAATPDPIGGKGTYNWAKKFGAEDLEATKARSMSEASNMKKQADVYLKKIQDFDPQFKGVPERGGLMLPEYSGSGPRGESRPSIPAPTAPQQGPLASVGQFMQKHPIVSKTAAGALSGFGVGYGGMEAARKYQEGDIPGFVLSSLGAIGSLGSVFPFTAPVAAPLAVAAPVALELLEGVRSERRANIPARKRFEARSAPTPEEIAAIEEMGPATSRQGLGFRP
jgi:hypothetical protein